jgi:GDPmannose 4,6-dehydratase
MKKAIVFGASGQMGSYLVDYLATDLGYLVTEPSHEHVDFEVLDIHMLKNMFREIRPDEIYNMVGLNYAPDSWFLSEKYLKVNGLAVQKLLEAVRIEVPNVKFFQAGSAEVFEKESVMQDEWTNRLPENPYGLSKMMAMELVRMYRMKYGLFACTGIFFNAESPRRDKFFFAEKVVTEAVRLKKDFDKGTWVPIELGQLGARRDWGWAPEYVQVAHRMLQQISPMDFVIGTGDSHDCKEFVREALFAVGLPDVDKDFDKYVKYPPEERKTQERNCMKAMPMKAEKFLGWKAKYRFKDVVRMLVEAEMKFEVPA